MFLVPMGRIADIYGRKRIFKYGITIDIIASILIAFSFNEAELIILRIFQGLGAAMIFGTSVELNSLVRSMTSIMGSNKLILLETNKNRKSI